MKPARACPCGPRPGVFSPRDRQKRLVDWHNPASATCRVPSLPTFDGFVRGAPGRRGPLPTFNGFVRGVSVGATAGRCLQVGFLRLCCRKPLGVRGLKPSNGQSRQKLEQLRPLPPGTGQSRQKLARESANPPLAPAREISCGSRRAPNPSWQTPAAARAGSAAPAHLPQALSGRSDPPCVFRS